MLTALMLFAMAAFGGMLVAISRRNDGQSDKEIRELRERVLRLEQSMESMTGDMERVAESQRFMTALLEDRGRNQGALKPPASADPNPRP